MDKESEKCKAYHKDILEGMRWNRACYYHKTFTEDNKVYRPSYLNCRWEEMKMWYVENLHYYQCVEERKR